MKGFLGAFSIFILWAFACIYYLHLKGDTSVKIVSKKANFEQNSSEISTPYTKSLDISLDTNVPPALMQKDVTNDDRLSAGLTKDSVNKPDMYIETKENNTSLDAQLLADEIKKTIAISDTVDIDKNEPEITSQLSKSMSNSASVSSKIFYPTYANSELILDKALVAYASELKIYLKEHPTKKITIVGHTDNVGNGNDNFRIGLKKSRQIKWYLTARRGIPRSKITAISRGEEEPIESNNSTWGRKKNNRIEIIID